MPMWKWIEAIYNPLFNPIACLPPEPDTKREEDASALLQRLEKTLQQTLKYALTGEKRSFLKGQGLDFADLREYTPGDDIRKIDWNVFARTLTPHIREYHEEKQLTMWLCIDATPSMHFGKRQTKWHLALELAGLFCLLAMRANHTIGALILNASTFEIIPPKQGLQQAQRIMNALLKQPGTTTETLLTTSDPLPEAFEKLTHIVQKNSTLIVLSDFLSPSKHWQKGLGQISRKTKSIYFHITDPTESVFPGQLGLVPLMDPENNQVSWLDTTDSNALREFQTLSQTKTKALQATLSSMGSITEASTEQSSHAILLAFIQQQPNRKHVS